MDNQVIVFDCDDEPTIKEDDEQDKPHAATNVYESETLNKRYADLLRLKKLKVLPRENNGYQQPQEEPSPQRPKSEFKEKPVDEVIIFNLEEEPSEAAQRQEQSMVPLRTAKFASEEVREVEPSVGQVEQMEQSEEIFVPSMSVHRRIQQANNEQRSPEASEPLSRISPSASILEENLPKYIAPQTIILNVAAEFRVERYMLFQLKFHLYLNGHHLLTARKKIIQSNSLYYFFKSSQDLSTRGSSYVGYMEANFNGTEYNVSMQDGTPLAYITHLIRKDQQTKSNLYFPKRILQKGLPLKDRVIKDDPTIVTARTKEAKFNQLTKKYTLNFQGRARMASVKNSVIEHNGEYALIMGKVQEKLYNLSFGIPFSELTAFAFAISNYEEKLGDNAKY